MKIGKILLICLLASPLGGCYLFQTTPQRVIEGQRAVYQGILLAEENDNKIIDRYISDTKAAMVYHINFILEPKIHAIRINADLNRGEKSAKIAIIEEERQAKLAKAFRNIDRIAEEMRVRVMKNHIITKKLVGAIYNYLSTSPIEIDNISFFIEQLHEARRVQN